MQFVSGSLAGCAKREAAAAVGKSVQHCPRFGFARPQAHQKWMAMIAGRHVLSGTWEGRAAGKVAKKGTHMHAHSRAQAAALEQGVAVWLVGG